MANRRPRRGNPSKDGHAPGHPSRRNVLIAGDTGIFGGAQGGAQPGATESGDLAAREFGVPQADLPGGVKHLVNPQTRATKPPGVHERPADEHKFHGVEPIDFGQYVTPPDATEERFPHPAPEPSYPDAVPVYIKQDPGGRPRIRVLITEGPQNIPTTATAFDPIRIADRDQHRVKFWIQNEAAAGATPATNGVRIGDWETVADGRGLLIPGGSTSPRDFNTQEAVFVINPSAAALNISYGYETEIEMAGLEPEPR